MLHGVSTTTNCSLPSHVLHVAAQVAAIKGVDLSSVLRENLRNVKEVYKISVGCVVAPARSYSIESSDKSVSRSTQRGKKVEVCRAKIVKEVISARIVKEVPEVKSAKIAMEVPEVISFLFRGGFWTCMVQIHLIY